jgi:beta-glucosidase
MIAQEHDMTFPSGFTWGAASSAYQIEGGATADGRGPSIWDRFCQQPGAIHMGQTGETACDHYHRFRDDIAMMRSLGLPAYRLSISWPRVLPDGVGKPNEAGLAFYDKLIDALLEANIQPWVTLFHWDMPEALFQRGGWMNRESADWFAEFAQLMSRRLSDRVSKWMTLNEPQVYIALGHADGKHAPGLKLSVKEYLLAGHHTLLAHGRGVQALRAGSKRPLSVGWAPVGHVVCPATESAADIDAARAAMFAIEQRHVWSNTWFGDPVCLGHYPADGLKVFGEDAPVPKDGDLKTICQPLDFYGLNIYSGSTVRAGEDGKPIPVPAPPGAPITTFRWLILPEALRWGPRFINERYRLPVVITENGMSNIDVIDLEGRVQDPQRIDYTRRYLLQLEKAINDGAKVDGYFHWSIMDNFEWAEGYKERFGMVHVDYVSQKRTLKDSALWYKKVIASNGGNLPVALDQAVPAIKPVVRPSNGTPVGAGKAGTP